MLTGRVHLAVRFVGPCLSFGAYLLICSPVFGQASPNIVNPAEHSPDQYEVTLTGCLVKRSGEFPLGLATESGFFLLTGQTAGLEQYNDRQLTLEGIKGPDVPAEGFPDSFPSLAITRLVEVIPTRVPKLANSFINKSSWQVETFQKYGVGFAHPQSVSATNEWNQMLDPNFVVSEGSEAAVTFEIPYEAYPYTDFSNGTFTIFVNRHITHPGSCIQFGRSDGTSSFRLGKLQYSESREPSGGMGTYYQYFYFHIFQHETCYELAFALVTHSPRMQVVDTGCNTPQLSDEDEWDLVKSLLESVTFFRSDVPPPPREKRRLQPQITEFSVAPDTASPVNGGLLFSWATQDVDYVDFTYTCTTPETAMQTGFPFVRILEGAQSFRSCRDFESSRTSSSYYAGQWHFYYSPNSSTSTSFSENVRPSECYRPMDVVVTLTPFSNGVAYPRASRSLTVDLDSGKLKLDCGKVLNEPTGMTLTYCPTRDRRYATSTLFYEQGSPLTIHWIGATPEDACVNLYLFQMDRMLLKLNEGPDCLKTSTRSYTWTVTDKYGVDSGFRILASTPDGTSSAWGPLFSIVRPDP